MARVSPSGDRLAGDQHRRRFVRTPRLGEEAQTPKADASPGGRPPTTERPTISDRRFQRPLPDGGRIYCYPLTVTDHTRVSCNVPGAALDQRLRVRPIFERPFRDSGSRGRCGPTMACLCDDGAARSYGAQRVVDPLGDSASTHPPATRKRMAPRTNAQDPKQGAITTPANSRASSSPSTGFARIERRAAPPIPGWTDARRALPPVAARVYGRAPGPGDVPVAVEI